MTQDIGQRLKQWRSFVGTTQAEFSRQIDVHVGVLKKYEAGQNVPGGAALASIAKTGVSLDWLLTGQGNMQRNAGPPPPQTSQNSPQTGQNTPFQGAQAANQPKSAVFARRLDAISQLLADIPESEAASVIEEFFSRAKSASELAALRQAVADLRTAQQRA
ncbi:helix-turn-helix domain-containing protein [Rhodoferax sp.]|uniref:helix-turn-helix domain-containing protein n=1 Tax=Rhodoferax sp. TaxID=50421 RepID=UPI00345B9FF7|nr:hypothetical protein [Rhodoferax sp.]